MVNKYVKKYFLKYGLPQAVLQSISDSVMNSFEEGVEPTEEEVEEKSKQFDVVAKSFQSEVDARVQTAVRKATAGSSAATDEEPDGSAQKPKSEEGNDSLKKMLEEMRAELKAIKSEKANDNYSEIARARLKEAKMTDKEIEATLYGRSFESQEQLDTFVEKQEELYSEILKNRISENLREGTKPFTSRGSASLESFKKDIEKFNESN